MRQILVVGNWKMNGSRAKSEQLLGDLKKELSELRKTDIAICPPFVYLSAASLLLGGTHISLGAQNVCENAQDSGAYTGEISASMLADLGCRFVIVGHSERRQYYNETGGALGRKITFSLQCGLVPILCVGETLRQRESGEADLVVEQQLQEIVESVGIAAFKNMVVAYEPVWAIGTGKTATPEIAQSMHALIRRLLSRYDEQVSDKIQLLYGGSVKPDSAAALFAKQDIDGALVGGACLEAGSFGLICKAAESL